MTLLMLLAVAPVAGAHGGWTHCGEVDTEVVTPAFWGYLVHISGTGPWFYQEVNGVDHLQRGSGADPCIEYDANGIPVPPDVLIF